MKSRILLLLALMGILFVSCEGRTGYLDDGQLSTVSLLTESEWLISYADYSHREEYFYDEDTHI